MRNTLICTVGTSLINNISRGEERLKTDLNSDKYRNLVVELLKISNTEFTCGAEINSITSICNSQLLSERLRLILLVSDTPAGQKTGEILKLYYQHKDNLLKFEIVELWVLQGLKDDNVREFKQVGLKNLVKVISDRVRSYGSEFTAINATGGYKAQISFAGMIGQALEIPVYYLFEKFSEVIELPPQPVALDLGLWLDNYLTFEQLETEQILEKSQVTSNISQTFFNTLIDEEIIDNVPYISLSAMGVLFHERCRLQFPKQQTTILSAIPQDDTSPQKKSIHLRDDHGKDILLDFSKKLCNSPFVKHIINSLPFNPKRKEPILNSQPNGIVDFVLTWTDPGYGVCIQTTGRNLIETNTIALHLQEKYGKK